MWAEGRVSSQMRASKQACLLAHGWGAQDMTRDFSQAGWSRCDLSCFVDQTIWMGFDAYGCGCRT